MNDHNESSVIKTQVTEPSKENGMKLHRAMSYQDRYRDDNNHVITLVQAESLSLQSDGQDIQL